MPGGALAQVIGTGPTVRYSAMPEMFESLMFAARREIVATTPYYVPDESLHNALCTTAYRGVDTMIVFPARNDSWIVGAADLLDQNRPLLSDAMCKSFPRLCTTCK
jgi:cardiolipin synthase A/B